MLKSHEEEGKSCRNASENETLSCLGLIAFAFLLFIIQPYLLERRAVCELLKKWHRILGTSYKREEESDMLGERVSALKITVSYEYYFD